MATERRPADAPPALFTFLEQRAVGELGAFIAATPMLRLVGRGDRHPVLVIPGFTASDRSTEVLRWYLRSLGYWTHGWQQGRNYGPNGRTVTGLVARLTELYERHGRTVSLVGQSLGGTYARHLALRYPGMVRSVITLGSPFRSQPGDHERGRAALADDDRAVPTADPPAHRRRGEPGPVRPVDGHLQPDGRHRGLAAVHRERGAAAGEHRGALQPLRHGRQPQHALYAVADRLAQPEGRWRPFRPPVGMRHLYPPAATYRPAA